MCSMFVCIIGFIQSNNYMMTDGCDVRCVCMFYVCVRICMYHAYVHACISDDGWLWREVCLCDLCLCACMYVSRIRTCMHRAVVIR
jgi:hypothetical protein